MERRQLSATLALFVCTLLFSSLSTGGVSLSAITRFPHQDTTKSNSEAFPLTLSNQTLMFVWAESTAIRYSKSTNGGVTWGLPVQFVTPISYARSLAGIRTMSGRIIVFWGDSGGVRSTLSDDEGLTWASPTPINIVSVVHRSIQASQADDGKLWVVVQPPLGGTRYVTSPDNGSSWSIFQSFPGSRLDACLISGQGGALHCIYATGIGASDIFRTTSTDGGTTWSSATPILNTLRSETRPRIARQSNGTFWMVYEFERSDSIPLYSRSDLHSVRSTDGGITWSSPEEFTRFVGDDLLHNVTMLNDEPFVTFASDRWETSADKQMIWYGIVGVTPDVAPPPILVSGSLSHTYNNTENWIRSFVDDEAGIAAVTADYLLNGIPQPAVELFDDGLHGDGGPGDNLWANRVDSLSVGSIECFFTVVDVSTNTIINRGLVGEILPLLNEPVVQGTSMTATSDTRGAFGRVVLPSGYPGFGLRYPVNSTIEHLFGGGLWVGGKIDTAGETTAVSTAYEGWAGPLFEFSPASPTDSIWRIFGVNATIPPGWEQYWGAGLPFHPLADQNFYNKYNDYTQSVPGRVSLGINVIQSAYAWDDQSADGIQILDFKIMNNSSSRIDSAYVGFFVDGHVGPLEIASCYRRNFSGYIAAERMGYIHNPVDFGSTPLGVSVLNMHKPPDSLRLAFQWFPGPETPGNDALKHALMSLDSIRPDQFPSLSDTRFIISFGPFTVQPHSVPNPDTLRIAFALLSAPDVTLLQQRASRARDIYATLTGVDHLGQDIPLESALEQNFPNPFNPSTKVRFRIAQAAYTTLEVFDILGRRVAVLVNEEKKPGVYTLDFDGSGFASGVYILRLKAGTYTSARKALLLR